MLGGLVWVKKDIEYCFYSKNGCTLLVYVKTAEELV